MDKQYPWKRAEDMEIDLADFLYRLCSKWKQLAVCALAAAFVLGGYGWIKGQDGTDTPTDPAGAGLTEEEGQAVTSAVQLAQEIDSLEAYLDGSILMKLDPYHKDRYIMVYSIDHANRQEIAKITESYLNFLCNGGAAGALQGYGSKDWEIDKSYLSELIYAYQKTYSSPYQVVVDGQADKSVFSESLFYVEVTGENAKMAEKMAMAIQVLLEEYAAGVKKEAGSHILTLISSETNCTADSGLQAQQHDKKALLATNKASLKTMTDAFGAAQTAAYEEATGKEGRQKELEKAASTGSMKRVIKYVIVGLMAGMFVYSAVFFGRYLFLDQIKSPEEIKRQYTFPVLGAILLEGSVGKYSRKLPGTKVQLLNRIRLSCNKQGVDRLCAASGGPFSVQERKCLEEIAQQLKSCGIDLAVVENVRTDVAVWDKLWETGTVILVCKIGATTHRMVDDMMGFYLENGITVAGAAVFM